MVKKLFYLLFLTFFFHIASAEQVLGLLTTKTAMYEHELDFSGGFHKLFERFGAKIKVIDYHKIYSEHLSCKIVTQLEEILESELKKEGITKVIIPGNYYNIAKPPYAPLPNRQKVTAALLNLANKGKVKILPICGGMQGIMHADGISIKNLKEIGMGSDHLFSYPDPSSKNVRLNKIMINPASNFAKIIKNNNLEITNNGWIVLYMPDYHTECVDFAAENIKLMEEKGYKIVGFSQGGVIEIVEDKMGNTYFQTHPESLLINEENKDFYDNKFVDGSIVGIYQFFKNFVSQ